MQNQSQPKIVKYLQLVFLILLSFEVLQWMIPSPQVMVQGSEAFNNGAGNRED